MTSQDPITIENNSFINTPSHAINIDAGVVTGNYFSGGGYQTGAHADAIWVGATTAPVSITNNFIDWTATPAAVAGTNNAIWLNPGVGSGVVANVTVSGNYLLGGQHTISAPGGPALQQRFDHRQLYRLWRRRLLSRNRTRGDRERERHVRLDQSHLRQ